MPIINARRSTFSTGGIEKPRSPPWSDDHVEHGSGHYHSGISILAPYPPYVHDTAAEEMMLDGICGLPIPTTFTIPDYSVGRSLHIDGSESISESPRGTRTSLAARSPWKLTPPASLSPVAQPEQLEIKSGCRSMDISSLLNPGPSIQPIREPDAIGGNIDEHANRPLVILTQEKTLASQVWQPRIVGYGSKSPTRAGSESLSSESTPACRDYLPSVFSNQELAADFYFDGAKLRVEHWEEDLYDISGYCGTMLFVGLNSLLLQARGIMSSVDHLANTQGNKGKQRHPYHDWVAGLFRWRQLVGCHAKAIIDIVINTIGHEHNNHAYVGTKTFSIYLWWRVCKMVFNIDCLTTHVSRKIVYADEFEFIENVFAALWKGLEIAIANDVEELLGTEARGHLIAGTFLGQGTVSVKELLLQGDLFETIPNLHDLPDLESSYRILGRLGSFSNGSPSGSNRDQKRFYSREADRQYRLLKLLFTGFPVLIVDYEQLLYRSNPTSIFTESRNLPASEPYSTQRITSNRPFRKYLDKVVIQIRPDKHLDAGKEVAFVYRDLLRGTESVGKLYIKLRRALATAPDLFKEFQKFVPERLKTKWYAVEGVVQTRSQVNAFKHQVAVTFDKLLEKRRANNQLSKVAVNTNGPTSLENLQADIELLSAAVLVCHLNPLTRQATNEIQDLKTRVQMAKEVFTGLIPSLGRKNNDDPRKIAEVLGVQWESCDEISKDLPVKGVKVVEDLDAHCQGEILADPALLRQNPSLVLTPDTVTKD